MTYLPDTPEERINDAIYTLVTFGGEEGAHHKQWVIDQTLRILTGDRYDQVVAEACNGEDGPNTYEWDTGVAP